VRHFNPAYVAEGVIHVIPAILACPVCPEGGASFGRPAGRILPLSSFEQLSAPDIGLKMRGRVTATAPLACRP
jgi:hypothetical protein